MYRQCLNLIMPIFIASLIVGGCAKPYKITQDLEEPIRPRETVYIGQIEDHLPYDTEESKKPTLEDINNFRTYLASRISEEEPFGTGDMADTKLAKYEVTGAILTYEKGSGFLRFLFGVWAGAAQVTVKLDLVDLTTGDLIFSGNFTGAVTDWTESGDEMFKRVSKNFVSAIKKRHRKLREQQLAAETES